MADGKKFLGLVKSAIKSTLAQAVGRIANILIPIIILYSYTPDSTTDSFFFAFSIAFLFWGTISNSITDSTVPALAQHNTLLQADKRFALSFAVAVVSVLILLIWSAVKPDQHLSVIVLLGVFLSTFTSVLASFIVAVLNVRNHFSIPGLLWGLRIVPLLIFWKINPDISYLPWLMFGIGLADLLRMLILHAKVRMNGISFVGWRDVLKGYTAVTSASIIAGLNPIVDRVIAGSGEVGDLTLLDLGERFYGIVGTLSTIGIMNVVLVELSGRAKLKNYSGYLNKALLLFLFWSSLWILMVLLSWPYVESMVFPSMKLSNEQYIQVELIFYYYLAGIPAFIIGLVCVRGLLSLGMQIEIAMMAVLSLSMNIVLSYLLHDKFGISGIALATSIVTTVITLIMIYLLSNKKHVESLLSR